MVIPPLPITFSGRDDCYNGFTRDEDHFDPAKLIIDAAGVDFGQFDIISHYVADLVQGLIIFTAGLDLPHTAPPLSFPLWLLLFPCERSADLPPRPPISISPSPLPA